MPRVPAHLITQSAACSLCTSGECCRKCAIPAEAAAGSPASRQWHQGVGRRESSGCSSSGELCPAPHRCQPRETLLIFTSLVRIRHGCFPNDPEVLYEPENRYRLQFYGAADNGRWTCVFSCCFQMPLQPWKLQVRFGISLLASCCFASYWILLEQQDLETLYRLLGESQENIPQRECLPFLFRLWTNHFKCSGSPSDVALCGFAQRDVLRVCHEWLGWSFLLRSSLPPPIGEVLSGATQGTLWQKLPALSREWRTEKNASSTVPGKKNYKQRALSRLYCCCDLSVEDPDVRCYVKTVGFMPTMFWQPCKIQSVHLLGQFELFHIS